MGKTSNRMGDKTVLTNTLECEIIGVCEDKRYVRIQFEDGEILERVNIAQFTAKQIRHPHIESVNMVGKRKKMRCGELCEVIEDNGELISVRFENGTELINCKKKSFVSGHLSPHKIIKNSFVGQTRKMINGMECTVIDDNGYKDITVKFADGTVLKKCRRDTFLSGKIKNPNYDPTSILGKSKMMNCGMKCKVIEDFDSENITVEFEDGTVVKNRTRHNFESGKISNPGIANSISLPQTIVYYFMKRNFPDTISNYRPSWLRSKTSNANMEIDIWIPSKHVGIEYDGYQWHKEETSTTLEKQRLITEAEEIEYLFTILERGATIHNSDKHINYQLDYRSEYNEYLGLFKQLEGAINEILNRLGAKEKALIDDELIDRLFYEIDVVEYRKVVIDNIDGIRRVYNDRRITGQKSTMNCGMECEVIEDLGYDRITVKFKDGTVVKNKTRHSFKVGKITNPNFSKFDITGEKAVMKNGMEATVIKDNGAFDITVKFADDTIVKTVRSAWKKGLVKNPSITKGSLLGESRIMNCGMACIVIDDNGHNDISVRFEDGTVVRHRKRQEFRNGGIDNPNIDRNSLIGISKKMKCGMECTVIEDKGANDISIRFEDGYERHHLRREYFKKGTISNPNMNSLVGQKRVMNCGMECEVISDKGYKNIDVKFSDGTILKKQRRDAFNNGNIKNPYYDPKNINGQERRMNCGLICKVIEDFNSEDITVLFENGIIRKHCTRSNFKNGKIACKENL